jgi:hypothetical protein
MFRKLCYGIPMAALVLLAGVTLAQGRADYPHLRAALHELREARGELKEARDNWPPGYKERALQSLDEAMRSVSTILEVKDVNSFRGVERREDYYKQYKDHPRMRAALQDLREARDELRTAKADFRGMKEQALDDIEVAIGDLLTLVRHDKR